MPSLKAGIVLPVLLATNTLAGAHEVSTTNPGPQTTGELLRAWSFEPGVVILLLVLLWAYLRGISRMRTPRPAHEKLCFAAGWLSLVVALISPLDAWGQALFSAHMVQHEVLMLVAAPLLILSRPLLPVLQACPRSWAVAGARLWHKSRGGAWLGWMFRPLGSWSVHACMLWVWHAPVLFSWTLRSAPIHALQHLSFFGSALLFWWAVFYGPRRHRGYGGAVLYLFTTALHSSLLGALLTFSRSHWYQPYLLTTAAWNLTPLEDQQLGGLIMWIPAGLVYIVSALALFALWLREAEARVENVRFSDRTIA